MGVDWGGIDEGIFCPNAAPAGTLPDGGGTGANKLFPGFAAIGAGVIVGIEDMVVAGGLLDPGAVAPDGVTITGGGLVCCAFNWLIFACSAASAAVCSALVACKFSAGVEVGDAVAAAGCCGAATGAVEDVAAAGCAGCSGVAGTEV